MRWHPNGNVLASGDRDGIVKLWTKQKADKTTSMIHDSGITAIRFSNDGQWLVTATATDKLYFWRANGAAIGKPLQLENIQIKDVFINDDNWGITVIDKSDRIYFTAAGDRFIPDTIIDYFDLLAQNELFKQHASKQKARDTASVLNYYNNPPKDDRSYWTAIMHGLILCEQHNQCRNSQSISQYFTNPDTLFKGAERE